MLIMKIPSDIKWLWWHLQIGPSSLTLLAPYLNDVIWKHNTRFHTLRLVAEYNAWKQKRKQSNSNSTLQCLCLWYNIFWYIYIYIYIYIYTHNVYIYVCIVKYMQSTNSAIYFPSNIWILSFHFEVLLHRGNNDEIILFFTNEFSSNLDIENLLILSNYWVI